MFLSKTRVALITVALTIIYFVAFYSLPESIIGTRALTDGSILFTAKIGFLATTAAIVTMFILLFIVRHGFFADQAVIFKKYRHYIKLLVKRDFVARYRKSVFGVLWSVLNPMLTMLVMYTVFSRLFRYDIEHYPVYILSGSILFNFFSESTSLAMHSIIESEGVIKKVYVPKYVFPLSKTVSSLVNLAFSFVALLIVFVITGVPFSWTIVLFPLPIIYLFVFALGIAMFMSSMAVFFRDLTHLYGVLLTLWMYLTPIFYPVDTPPAWILPYYRLNPMYQFINYFRSLTIWNTVPDLWSNMVCIAYALVALCIGTFVFMRRQNRYILYL